MAEVDEEEQVAGETRLVYLGISLLRRARSCAECCACRCSRLARPV
jgi:hypothetical protein